MTRRSTAVHEAAHAVLAEWLGAKVLTVKLYRRRPGCGEMRARWPGDAMRDPVARALVALAGHEAEHLFYGRPLQYMPAEDRDDVRALGIRSGKSLNLIGWLTRRVVASRSRAIRRVADALLTKGRLNRRQFLAALGAE